MLTHIFTICACITSILACIPLPQGGPVNAPVVSPPIVAPAPLPAPILQVANPTCQPGQNCLAFKVCVEQGAIVVDHGQQFCFNNSDCTHNWCLEQCRSRVKTVESDCAPKAQCQPNGASNVFQCCCYYGAEPRKQQQLVQQTVDLVILMEDSQNVKDFVVDLFKALPLGKNGVFVSLAKFGDRGGKEEVTLDSEQSVDKLIDKLNELTFATDQSTDLIGALKQAQTMLNEGREKDCSKPLKGKQCDVVPTILVLTTGKDLNDDNFDETKALTEQLQKDGTQLTTLLLGDGGNMKTWSDIVHMPEKHLVLANYNNLKSKVLQMARLIGNLQYS